jgi:hypothetical protein
MVTELLKLLSETPQGLTVLGISRRLHIQPTTLTGILEWLTHSGRLMAVGPDGGLCNTCHSASDCQLIALHGVRYVIVNHRPAQTSFQQTCEPSHAI